MLRERDHFREKFQLELWIFFAVSGDDGCKFMLSTIGGERIFHMSDIETVIVLGKSFSVDRTVTPPISHTSDFLDVFEDTNAVEFGDARGSAIRKCRGHTHKRLLSAYSKSPLPES
jgi:hypothetical protein